MLKRYYLAFLLLLYSHQAYSSIWGDIWGCITDPCNCGSTTIDENWNGGSLKRTFKPDPVCPPWNRRDGRDFDNCLLQFDPPKAWTGFYLQHCAESTPESNYFSPKIRIRTQSCNPFACWSQTSTLHWDGDCVLWPGAFGLPLLRICARIAIPSFPPSNSNPDGVPADPGYTVGEHLNNVGYPEADPKYANADGTLISYDQPKLCAYSDPGLVNLVSATGVHIDPMDWDPYRQPLHETTKTHPLIKVLIFLVENSGGANPAALLGTLLDMIGAEEIPGLNVLQVILKAIGKIFDLFTDLVILTLKSVGSLNGAVDLYRFGCVELPLGPYPPPFCPKLEQLFPSPSIRPICSKKYKDITPENWKISYLDKYKGSELFIEDSDTKCVVSKLSNNVIQNVVRISLDNLVPLCRGDQNPEVTDKCVKIKAITVASDAHTKSAYRDTIKKCMNASDTHCVDTIRNFSCNVTSPNSCQDGVRIVYAQQIGNTSTISNYYDNNIQDCINDSPPHGHTTCQKIWGINTGEFIDVPVTFPTVQTQTVQNLTTLEQTANLTDSNNIKREFRITIARDDILDSSLDPNLQRNTKSICASEGNQLIGCVNRILDNYTLKTYNCGVLTGVSCPNTNPIELYFIPKFVAQLETNPVIENGVSKTFKTSTVVMPLSINTSSPPPSGVTEALVNLAGFTYSSFMAYISDDRAQYVAAPFSGAKSINPSSIYGQYKDNKAPYNSSGQEDTSAVYLNGLEYVNGKYIQGGTHSCLQSKNTEKCIPGIKENNCVLTKLAETDTIDCKIFKDKSVQYNNLGICKADDKDCRDKETIAGVTIRECGTAPAIYYCYVNNKNSNVEVCKVTQDLKNRIIPAPNEGDTISDSSKHFSLKTDTNGKPNYNESTEAIREKTSLELGLCNKYLIPKCSSKIEYNANWPETEVGKISKGTCQNGFVPISNKPLERYCLAKASPPLSIAFDKLEADIGCKKNEGLKIVYDDSNSNFDKNNVESTVNYNDATKIGTIQLGNVSEGHLNDTLRCANYQITIPDITKIEYFRILKKSSFDDYLTITVNNIMMLTMPPFSGLGNFLDMKFENNKLMLLIPGPFLSSPYWQIAPDVGRKFYFHEVYKFDDYDLMSTRLTNGINNVKICLGVVGGGSIDITMEYKLKP